MSENVEMGYVLSGGIEGTAMLVKGSIKAVQEVMRLLQWMVARVKSGKLKPEEYKELQKLLQQTEGKITYLNIPAENEQYISKVKEDLEKMKVPYYVLPDLNAGDGMIQIIYPQSHKAAVMPWFENYCTRRLEEGSLSQQTLTALAGGKAQTGIITVPTEEAVLLREMEADFKAMHLSYCLMPDANVGDGTREVLYAKQDEAKIQSWLENFCQKHVVKGGEKTAKELQALAGNKSQVGFINIPAEASGETLARMREDFSMLGVNYHVMEDMRTGDGLIQIMYLKKDETAVRNWYSNYATDRLIKGGEHSYKDLVNLTAGKTRIVSIPLPAEALADMKADFDSLHTKKADRMTSGDQFWEDGPKMLLISIFDYVWLECTKSEKNWTSVFKYLDMVTVSEDTNAYERLMDYLEACSDLGGSHPAVKNYKIFKSGAQETMQSVLAVLYARLQCFRLEKVQWLTSYDECALYDIGLGVHGNPERKVAFFVLIPDETVLYSPIVGMLYTQLFQILFAQARKCGGALPFDVGFYLDEYANIKMPANFIREIATIRSRRIYAKIFIQSISQMKSLHEKDWETVFGNCDTLLYLGSGEKGSYEYISGLLGEFTLNKRSNGVTYGAHGNASSNVDSIGRKLMPEDELRRMKKSECIVLLSGEDPVKDKKYQTEKCGRFKNAVELGTYEPALRAERSGMRYVDTAGNISVEFLSRKEEAHYRKQAKAGMPSPYILLDEEALLQMDFTDEEPDAEQIRKFLQENREVLAAMREEDEEEEMDLTFGSAYDWLNRYPLSPEQTEEVIAALEAGLSDDDIRQFYDPDLSAQRMNQMRRLMVLNKRNGGA